ncbi:MAG: hypothetical protein ACOC15_01325 [Desulfovibrionales bacterium]
MAQGSVDSTKIVFKRGPASPLEEYTVDSRMLEIYFALEDSKTVGTLARELRLPDRDVLKTLELLRAQNLVSSVTQTPPRSPQQPHPASHRTRQPPKSSGPKTPATHKTAQKAGSTTGSTADHHPEASEKPGPSRSPESPKSARASADPAPEVTNPSPEVPARKAGRSEAQTLFPDKGGSIGAGNFFDIGRSATRTETDSPSSNYPPSPPQDSGEGSGTPREDASPEAAQAIELFEQGLSALQRKDYEEALRLFELSIERNPENRACRANLQRVKKILAPEGPSAFG